VQPECWGGSNWQIALSVEQTLTKKLSATVQVRARAMRMVGNGADTAAAGEQTGSRETCSLLLPAGTHASPR
jgi:hypothetical protein